VRQPIGTEAALLELRRLAAGDTAEAERVLNGLTLTVIPRVNPDGAMYATNTDDDPEEERLSRRQNTQKWTEGESRYEPYYHGAESNGPLGYDLNRDFNIRPDFDAVPGADDRAA
jgi:murein tripeptide amidase MpaA